MLLFLKVAAVVAAAAAVVVVVVAVVVIAAGAALAGISMDLQFAQSTVSSWRTCPAAVAGRTSR